MFDRARTCRNLLAVEAALWSFVEVAGVEPTNNAAERSLRRAVLWRRKSLGAKSDQGSQFVERILSVVTTLRQQGRADFRIEVNQYV
jgi:transposase